ncbi:MAG: exosome complex protein Rrp42 [Candidatus Bathyarchaeia archaeon]|nr:exosome complex protein Rrp42 [Candidatus Bathyarchaeota archaeon]
MSSIITSRIRQRQIYQMIASGKRLDGRGLTEYRPIKVEMGIIERAEGSARVLLGKTEVIAGVKVELGEPFPDRPSEGSFTVNSEFMPLASPEFEPGPPDENAIELARVVDRGIRESHAIDLEKLCLIPGKKVYVLFIDIYALNHDGNLIDASALAALAALMNTKLPVYVAEGGEIKKTSEYMPLPIKNYPVTVTFANIGDKMVVDPWLEEEEVMSARLTVAVDKDDKICALQKGGGGALTPQQILEAVQIAREKAKELRRLVVGNLG